MIPARFRKARPFVSLLAASIVLALQGCATAPAPRASVDDNFGFPLTFSPAKMDPKADPRQDFRRYAGGRWLDAAYMPGDSLEISGYLVMSKAVEKQVRDILEDAARKAPTAPKGSPEQMVGDLYASGLDVERLKALGVKPLAPIFERMAAAKTPKQLAETIAWLQLAGVGMHYAVITSADPNDRTRVSIFMADGGLPLPQDMYLKPENARIREGYAARIAGYFEVAGSSSEAAKVAARTVLAMETRLAKAKLTPLEQRDPAKRFVRRTYADVKRDIPMVDLDALFAAFKLPTGAELIVVDGAAMVERNAMLLGAPAADVQAYMQWEVLRQLAPYLTPDFDKPNAAFNVVLYGKDVTPPRDQQVARQVPGLLGHPISKLYVERYFSAQTRRDVEGMVERVKKEFRSRIEANTWLSPETRAQALGKLDKTRIYVGYPDKWVDYSSVDVRRDDYLGNQMRLSEFVNRREIAKYGKPVELDHFNNAKYTLPIVINAAYDSGWNGIEIPAAFLQPPFYDKAADAAVNYCTMGAVIGHELTHGFDSQGRLYDAVGNVRNWWTQEDAKRFTAETAKLAKQADAYEILPGLKLNGALEVTENLADVGGISFGYAALEAHLRENPAENKPVGGFTPAQRCFLAWGQLWASKANEGAMRQTLPTDGHPPGEYRMAAPAQHEQGFYGAFGIKAGDRMWLAPSDRVKIW